MMGRRSIGNLNEYFAKNQGQGFVILVSGGKLQYENGLGALDLEGERDAQVLSHPWTEN